ncbi:hypothetical protein ACWD5R_43360 [Streptomyces sp. NPDC002514]|uniref:hypothetical protein n=1 Tax=Streptomyces sp. NPDC001270 TaxID=3364554 RepID=UPI0036CAB678
MSPHKGISRGHGLVLSVGPVAIRDRPEVFPQRSDLREIRRDDGIIQSGEKSAAQFRLLLQPALRVRDRGYQLGLDLFPNAGQIRDVPAQLRSPPRSPP